MPYINAAQISGNLGKDAETMTTQGRTVTRFSIASTKKWTDKANKTHESTYWFRVAAWGQPHQVRQLSQERRSGPGPGRAANRRIYG